MNADGRIKLNMRPINRILRDKGLAVSGDIQRFHTNNVLRRIIKYMPKRSGATIKLAIAQTDIRKAKIVTDTPYAKYLYYGKVMAGGPPMRATDHDLNYSKTKNPLAGPYWDRALRAAEGRILQEDLQAYINRKASTR